MKFTIVTAVYNMEKWLSKTIETVLDQKGDFEIEYIVISDKSTDRSYEIAKKYEQKVLENLYPIRCKSLSMKVFENSENVGMYESINRGFRMGTGNIFAWINADDTYQEGALQAMKIVFSKMNEVEWVKGTNITVDENWNFLRSGKCRIYRYDWLKDGAYGMEAYFIEQENVFWRKELWEKAGPIPKEYRSAGDYWLWLEFAKYAKMYSLNTPVGAFMKREGQISKGVSKYKMEQIKARPHRKFYLNFPRIFFSLWSRTTPKLDTFFLTAYRYIFLRKEDVYLQIVNDEVKVLPANSFYCIMD